MVDDSSSPRFSQEDWPSDVAFWLFNGKVKIPIGCDVCGQVLRYRPGSRQASNWEERYYCPHCGWPDEQSSSPLEIPAVYLEDEESPAEAS